VNKQKVETQTVQSYVRNISPNKHEANEVDNKVALVTVTSIALLSAIVFWQVTVPATLFIGAAYGVKTVITSNPRQTVIEAVVAPQNVSEAPKVKRHYAPRITVNNYQTGKSVRV